MKTLTITKAGQSTPALSIPLTLVDDAVLGGDGWQAAHMIALNDADSVCEAIGDAFASDAINYQMLDGGAAEGELNGFMWRVEG